MPAKTLPPVLVSFAVTQECNLRCKHCYTGAADSPHPNELTTAEAKRLITEIAKAGTRMLIFDGGEPLLRPDIYQLLAYAKEVGLPPMMGTNATLLSTEAVEKLRKAGIATLAISLHGADAKTHDEFCQSEGSWGRAMLGIHNATAAGIPFQINTCVHHYNLAQFDAIISLAKELGAIAIEVFSFVPVGRGKEHPDLTLTPKERQYLVSRIIKHQLEEGLIYRCVAIPQFWVEVEKKVAKEAMPRFIRSCCGAGLRYCCILYEGTVYPCMVLQRKAGNMREKSFAQIWQQSQALQLLRNREKLEGKCQRCDYRQVCGGTRCLVFENTGSLTGEDGDCWFKEEPKKPVAVAEVGCQHCGRETIAVCAVCQSSLCQSHSFSCPLCHACLCHPDASDCLFRHKC